MMLPAALLVLAAGTLADAQPGPPTAGPEHKRMAFFAGTWDFKGDAKASPMGPAGPVAFTETCEVMDGGFAVICRSEGKGPTGPTKSVSIMGYDPERKMYTYTAAESQMPVFTAYGKLTGNTWAWTTESKMGEQVMRMNVTIAESGKDAYTFRMDMVPGGGAPQAVVEGKSTRRSAK
jgi:hypothetical protein